MEAGVPLQEKTRSKLIHPAKWVLRPRDESCSLPGLWRWVIKTSSIRAAWVLLQPEQCQHRGLTSTCDAFAAARTFTDAR